MLRVGLRVSQSTARRTRCHSADIGRLSRSVATTKPDILKCEGCDLYPYGEPTSDKTKALFCDLNWRIRDSPAAVQRTEASSTISGKPEAWALIGARAAILADAAILGRARADPPQSRSWPFISKSTPVEERIKKVSFNTRLESTAPGAVTGEFTDYTARYFSIRADEEAAITLRKHLVNTVQEEDVDHIFLQQTIKALKLDHLLDIPLVALSNGQTRRARIARALLARPEVLILEEPFTGLDVASRQMIGDLLGQMHQDRSPRVVLILRPHDTIPAWVDNIVRMPASPFQYPAYIGNRAGYIAAVSASLTEKHTVKTAVARQDAPVLVDLREANVGYKDRKVLKQVTWTIREGDRLALTGANGSGKSTLLSLILGDHPASFSQQLSLFGKPRLEHSNYTLSSLTGHFSPELYSSFPRRHGDAGLSIFEAIGTGFDNVFSYRKLSEVQKERIKHLVDAFDPAKNIMNNHFMHKVLFAEASPPLQALTLILRAMVKQPALLILDEPFAGMDDQLIQRCRSFLDDYIEPSQALIFISHYREEWPASLGKEMHLENGEATENLL